MKTLNINWNKYTPFEQKVFKAILKIPKGQVLTYGQVARKIGKPKAARAVGQALSRNQDAPTIPCHRVVGASGFGGYSGEGGVKSKLKLLKGEGFILNA
jgi:methylated-DNA-[protein]-cysteine S-methyltransferase